MNSKSLFYCISFFFFLGYIHASEEKNNDFVAQGNSSQSSFSSSNAYIVNEPSEENQVVRSGFRGLENNAFSANDNRFSNTFANTLALQFGQRSQKTNEAEKAFSVSVAQVGNGIVHFNQRRDHIVSDAFTNIKKDQMKFGQMQNEALNAETDFEKRLKRLSQATAARTAATVNSMNALYHTESMHQQNAQVEFQNGMQNVATSFATVSNIRRQTFNQNVNEFYVGLKASSDLEATKREERGKNFTQQQNQNLAAHNQNTKIISETHVQSQRIRKETHEQDIQEQKDNLKMKKDKRKAEIEYQKQKEQAEEATKRAQQETARHKKEQEMKLKLQEKENELKRQRLLDQDQLERQQAEEQRQAQQLEEQQLQQRRAKSEILPCTHIDHNYKYNTKVNSRVHVRGTGDIGVNMTLIYYGFGTNKYRIEVTLQDQHGKELHSFTTPNILVKNQEDKAVNYRYRVSEDQAFKAKKVKLTFRYPV